MVWGLLLVMPMKAVFRIIVGCAALSVAAGCGGDAQQLSDGGSKNERTGAGNAGGAGSMSGAGRDGGSGGRGGGAESGMTGSAGGGTGGTAGAAGAGGNGHTDAGAAQDATGACNSDANCPATHACNSYSDGGVGYVCGYSIAEGCGAIRRCQQQPFGDAPIAYCGCNGTVVETAVGSDYVWTPVKSLAGGTNSVPTCATDASGDTD
jgi:hypothetical protein